MSTNTTRYAEKKRRADRMYAPMPVPPDLGYPNAEAIRRRYGDASPVVGRDDQGHPVRRSQTGGRGPAVVHGPADDADADAGDDDG